MYDVDILNNLFNVVVVFIKCEGGDGVGWIISKDYIYLAEKFYEYESNNGRWFLDKKVYEDYISFVNNQEGILFCKDRSNLPTEWADNIVVEI